MSDEYKWLDDVDKIVERNNEMAKKVEHFFEKLTDDMKQQGAEAREYWRACSQLEKENEELEKKTESLERFINEQQSEIASLKQTLERDKIELPLLQAQYDDAVNQTEVAYRRQELTEQDKRLLQEAKLKRELYQEFTNIKWDYTVKDDEPPRGYVRNKNTGFKTAFVMKNGITEESTESLWRDCLTAASGDWSQAPAADEPNEAAAAAAASGATDGA